MPQYRYYSPLKALPELIFLGCTLAALGILVGEVLFWQPATERNAVLMAKLKAQQATLAMELGRNPANKS